MSFHTASPSGSAAGRGTPGTSTCRPEDSSVPQAGRGSVHKDKQSHGKARESLASLLACLLQDHERCHPAQKILLCHRLEIKQLLSVWTEPWKSQGQSHGKSRESLSSLLSDHERCQPCQEGPVSMSNWPLSHQSSPPSLITLAYPQSLLSPQKPPQEEAPHPAWPLFSHDSPHGSQSPEWCSDTNTFLMSKL